MAITQTLSRDVPLITGHTALLFVDVQNYNCRPDGGQYRGMSREHFERTHGEFFATLRDVAIPNWQKLQSAFRAGRVEILYTVIASLTADGRDRSLDYKISGFHVPPNSRDAQVIDAIQPDDDEMVIPKTSSSVFMSTNIDYVLRNLAIRSLVVAGVLTDQCVDSTIRDACDLGYLVTVVTDACATLSRERHESSLRNNAGYARQITTNALIAEISALPQRAGARTVTSQGATSEALIFVGTCDLAGLVRGKAFPAADLAARKHSGVGLTGSNIMLSAFGPVYATPFGTFGDLKLVPDLATRTRITAADGSALELVLGDVQNLDDSPWSCCPRTFLRRGLEKLESEFDLRLHAAFENEFVYTGVEDRAGSSYAFDMYRRSGGFGSQILAELRAAGIIPDSFLPEYAARQFELTVKPSVGVRAADDAVLLREIVRACAASRGSRAIFAPVIEPDGVGSGTHIHLSLRDRDGQPLMYDANRPLRVSARAAPFLAGILEHAPALTAVTTPSVPSFYRLRPNKWAPVWANIGEQDRGSALRICPIFTRDPAAVPASFHVEYRIVDGTASPYMALGALVHAGLDGLRRNLALPDHPQGPGADYATADVRELPRSLSTALDLLERTQAALDWFGAEFLSAYLMFKRSEIEAVAALSEDDVCRRYVEVY